MWELLVGAALLASAGLLFAFSKRIPISYQILLWALWTVILAILFRRGWIRLFGPVLFYDLVRSGRRTRNILMRCLYALALLLVLYTVYLEFAETIERGQVFGYASRFQLESKNQWLAQQLAKFAESFFIMFMEVQFVGVFLLTPAYAAGAISEEKDRRTLEFLLATDLDNREIVLGKLVSRLLGMMLLVLAGLPILSLVQFFGGVDPALLLSGFAATGLTMLSLAGLSILNSVYTKKPRDAIVLTYLIVVTYLGFSGLSRWLITTPPAGATTAIPTNWDDLLEWIRSGNLLVVIQNTLNIALDWFSSGNLFVMIHQLRESQAKGILLEDVLPGLLGKYALVHGMLAFLTTVTAVARLRPVAMASATIRPRRVQRFVRTWRPLVRKRPMMWKEIILESGLGFNRLGKVVLGLIILASFLPALWIGYHFFNDSPTHYIWSRLEEAINQWVRTVGTIVATLVLLGIGIRAAGAVSGERDRQTLDSLLTTPLSTKEILGAKWLGSILSVRWAMLWLCVIWALGAVTGGLDRTCLPWLILVWCIYAAFMASLGLFFSTIHQTTQRASIWTLTVTGFIFGGHWVFSYFLCLLVPTGRGNLPLGASPSLLANVFWYFKHIQWFGLTPPVALSWMAFRAESFHLGYLQSITTGEDITMGAFLGIAIGLVFWAAMTWFLWKLTVRRFNLLAGRRKIQRIDKQFARNYPKFRPVLSPEESP
jgi:ABC-type transport system involved in multi-copper enzyme maturation permease subunit